SSTFPPGLGMLVGALVFALALGAYVVAAAHDPRHLWSMIDLQVYRWGGEMARHHRNVYDLQFEGFLSFTYTPLAVLAFELMSHLSLGVLRFVMTGSSLAALDRKSTRLNSSHVKISYAVFCL